MCVWTCSYFFNYTPWTSANSVSAKRLGWLIIPPSSPKKREKRRRRQAFNIMYHNIRGMNTTLVKLIFIIQWIRETLTQFNHYFWVCGLCFALLCPPGVDEWNDECVQEIGIRQELLLKTQSFKCSSLYRNGRLCVIEGHVLAFSTHQSSSVSFCKPLWVTPSRSSSSWRTRSVASVSLLLTSSLSSDSPCDERSSSYRTERQQWVTVTDWERWKKWGAKAVQMINEGRKI